MKVETKKQKFRRLEKVRCSQVVPETLVQTLLADADDEAAEAQAAWQRADDWAHSAPGTPYAAVRAVGR